ncbi:hypothetical protein WA026_001925 [Henosepilachna vigintioctopunctata]|uniref:Uncharacterized protein n=1 Tax=Henosepilachna vigintioctopunctata TaxID=420089 RepID=A0AAW1UJL8_9CUCU
MLLNANGIDEISPLMLKYCSPHIDEYILLTINCCIELQHIKLLHCQVNHSEMTGNNVNHVELLSDWLKDTWKPQEFEEPILDDFVLQTLQFAYDKFHLDVYVFISSVCIIEQ